MMQAPNGVDPRDWATIVQSELAAMAVDRELQEGLIASATAWNIALAGLDEPAGRPGADAPARSAPAGDAPGPGGTGPGGA